MSAVKPSNYTIGDNQSGVFSRFIVPPMFMVTIGDLYKFQPMVITSINLNVPDDAAWETLNENNSDEWSYLTNIIKSPSIGKNYAQLPREAEIAITCNLLEKERAVIGGSHFGHAPRKNTFGSIVEGGNLGLTVDNGFEEGGKDYLPQVTTFHKEMVVNNISVAKKEDLDRAITARDEAAFKRINQGNTA
jgi:hypothetical protein